MVFGFTLNVSWRVVGYALLIGSALGGYCGYRLGSDLDALHTAQQQVAEREGEILTLKETIRHQAEILDQDAVQAQNNLSALTQLTEQANALQGQISNRLCFTRADVDRLRVLWGAEPTTPASRPARRKGFLGLHTR